MQDILLRETARHAAPSASSRRLPRPRPRRCSCCRWRAQQRSRTRSSPTGLRSRPRWSRTSSRAPRGKTAATAKPRAAPPSSPAGLSGSRGAGRTERHDEKESETTCGCPFSGKSPYRHASPSLPGAFGIDADLARELLRWRPSWRPRRRRRRLRLGSTLLDQGGERRRGGGDGGAQGARARARALIERLRVYINSLLHYGSSFVSYVHFSCRRDAARLRRDVFPTEPQITRRRLFLACT